jgi:hypothetical protein
MKTKLEYGFWFVNWLLLIQSEGEVIPGQATYSSGLWGDAMSSQGCYEVYASALNRFPFCIGYTLTCWLYLIAKPMRAWTYKYLMSKVEWTGSFEYCDFCYEIQWWTDRK